MTPDTLDDDFVTARLEPCERFDADGSGSPVCAVCGWLDGEHDRDALVHELPPVTVPATSRLAS